MDVTHKHGKTHLGLCMAFLPQMGWDRTRRHDCGRTGLDLFISCAVSAASDMIGRVT